MKNYIKIIFPIFNLNHKTVAMKEMVNLSKLLALFIIGSGLVGCYNKEEFKHIIQNGYDKACAKTKVKGDFCYYTEAFKPIS